MKGRKRELQCVHRPSENHKIQENIIDNPARSEKSDFILSPMLYYTYVCRLYNTLKTHSLYHSVTLVCSSFGSFQFARRYNVSLPNYYFRRNKMTSLWSSLCLMCAFIRFMEIFSRFNTEKKNKLFHTKYTFMYFYLTFDAILQSHSYCGMRKRCNNTAMKGKSR